MRKEQVINFFNTLNLDIENHPILIEYFLQAAIESYQDNMTYTFATQTLGKFLNINEHDIYNILVENMRPKRSRANYERSDTTPIIRTRGDLIGLLGTREQRNYTFIPNENAPKSVAENIGRHARILNSAIMRSPDKYSGAPIIQTPTTGRTLQRVATTSTGTLFASPPKRKLVKYDPNLLPSKEWMRENHNELFRKPETFHFTVTKNELENRINNKRKTNQKKATGYSAKELMKTLGVFIMDKISVYHLSHRQGHAFGGDTVNNNLDAATSGSNYYNLFVIENPIQALLNNNEVDNNFDTVNVEGVVEYHHELPLPQKITYTVRWGNGRYYTTEIFPLDHRSPSIQENTIAKVLMQNALTPMKQTPNNEIEDTKETIHADFSENKENEDENNPEQSSNNPFSKLSP